RRGAAPGRRHRRAPLRPAQGPGDGRMTPGDLATAGRRPGPAGRALGARDAWPPAGELASAGRPAGPGHRVAAGRPAGAGARGAAVRVPVRDPDPDGVALAGAVALGVAAGARAGWLQRPPTLACLLAGLACLAALLLAGGARLGRRRPLLAGVLVLAALAGTGAAV